LVGDGIGYSAAVPATRWGEAIERLLVERGWSKKQLADKASVRPNTLTNIITHGKPADTATLTRIADAFNVDIAELFLTREQAVVLRTHQENQVERVKQAVLSELSGVVERLVRQELEAAGVAHQMAQASPHRSKTTRRR
jgi:transcriptional regulator with XRE-family HTH domain